MKDFQDFLSTLSETDYQDMKNEIMLNRTPCSASDAIPEISYKMSLKLLEKYHNWLHN